jgi:hypothetical protein
VKAIPILPRNDQVGFPHSRQNLEFAGTEAPQLAHFLVLDMEAPQFGQNLVPSGTFSPHFGQGTMLGISLAPHSAQNLLLVGF